MKSSNIYLLLFAIIYSSLSFAQDMVSTSRLSQRATITQRLGSTDITITYHSPNVQGRKIFGGIVPYDFIVDGKEYPWRAGSNQNTTFEFTHDVKINGRQLAAGTYGFHIFVSKNIWTLIFSNVSDGWGSFGYDKDQDALRVDVHPESSEFQEWLSYDFVDRKAESAAVELKWERTLVKFVISTDVHQNILNDLLEKEERSGEDFLTIANMYYQLDPIDLNQTLNYLDSSISIEPHFRNQVFKADVLLESGNTKEGQKLKDYAMTLAKDFDWYYYGLSHYLLHEDKDEAFSVLSQNIKQNPENWSAYLAMGEFYIRSGNQKKVVENLKKAYELAGERSKNYARYMYYSNKLILENQEK